MTTYISIDIETDGPIIGINSMLSLGAAAYSFEHNYGNEPIDTFEVNLVPLPGAVQDKATMEEFWARHPEQYKYATENQEPCADGTIRFKSWVKGLPKPRLAVAYPDSFDYAWVRYYFLRFTGEDVLSYESLDIKSLMCGVLKKPFMDIKTSNIPGHWRDKTSRAAHRAVNDALDQGTLLMNILREIGIND